MSIIQPKTFVFAGNKMQFDEFLRNVSPEFRQSRYIYVTKEEDFYGRRPMLDIIKIGTWYEREENYKLIEHALYMMGFTK